MSRRWTVDNEYALVRAADLRPEDAIAAAPPVVALGLLDRWFGQPHTRRALVRIYEDVEHRWGSVAPRSDRAIAERVRPRIEDALRSARLVALRAPRRRLIEEVEAPPALDPADEGDDEDKVTWFSLKLLDEVGDPIDGAELLFEVDGKKEKKTTDGAGVARVIGHGSVASAHVADLGTLKAKLDPRWKEIRDEKIEPGDEVTVREIGKAADTVQLHSELAHTLVIKPSFKAYRARLIGMFFDMNKCFLLPSAIPGMKGVRRFYKHHPTADVLVVGHTDTDADDAYNSKLSLERAEAIAAYLTDDADKWMPYFDRKDMKGWGLREVQHMLSVLPEKAEKANKFYVGKPNGGKDKKHIEAVKKFQTSKGMNPSGEADTDTKKALVVDYMAIDETTLPKTATLTPHGCGEFFPAKKTGDGVSCADNRRVELFFFEQGIKPPPPGELSKRGSKEYPRWLAQVVKTVDFSDAASAEGTTAILKVIDELGKPVKGKKFRIKLPDGTIEEGTLPDTGEVTIEDVEPGECEFTLLEMDQAEWDAA